jgi:cytochrome bd-type quinol oxidase subunit 2
VSSLREKTKNALDEARILVLGTQVLLGFEYRAFFEPRFDHLPHHEQSLRMVGLFVLLVVIAIVMVPAARHRIVERGQDSVDFFHFALSAAGFALVPFGLAIGLDLYLASATVASRGVAIAVGAGAAAVALGLWYGGWPLRRPEPQHEEGGPMKLEDKIVQVLTETRVVLPGAQALFGFQLAITLMDAYERLPESSKIVHLGSIAFIALAIIFLMAPAAYHRIVEHGEDTERFHRFASWMVLLAMAALPPGFAGDVFVVVRKHTESARAGAIAAAVTIAFFYGLWFVAMAWVRARRRAAA